MLSIVFGVCIDKLDIVLDSSGSDCNKKSINKILHLNDLQGENTHSSAEKNSLNSRLPQTPSI